MLLGDKDWNCSDGWFCLVFYEGIRLVEIKKKKVNSLEIMTCFLKYFSILKHDTVKKFF